MKTIIITGPPGSGKTLNAACLMAHFDSQQLVDEWDGKTPLPAGALALTNSTEFDASQADAVFDISSALQQIQNNTGNVANSASLSR